MLKFMVDDGYMVTFYFVVRYNGDQHMIPLKGELWLPFSPTIGLCFCYQGVDYPPIKSLKYHIGTNQFTAILEENALWDYYKDDVLSLYSLCEEGFGANKGVD